MGDFQDCLAALIGAFDPAMGRDEAFGRLVHCAGDVGFPFVICAPVRNHPSADKNWLMTNYPEDWQKLYASKRYLKRNPVREKALVTSKAFTWNSVESALPEGEREIFHDSRTCGMNEGIVIPIHGPWGQVVAVGFATPYVDAVSDVAADTLQILASRFCYVTVDDGYVSDIRLTPREHDVLVRVALGYSGYQIADSLGLSTNSVEWHMKNIFTKLNVRNRTAALVKALQMGLMHL